MLAQEWPLAPLASSSITDSAGGNFLGPGGSSTQSAILISMATRGKGAGEDVFSIKLGCMSVSKRVI